LLQSGGSSTNVTLGNGWTGAGDLFTSDGVFVGSGDSGWQTTCLTARRRRSGVRLRCWPGVVLAARNFLRPQIVLSVVIQEALAAVIFSRRPILMLVPTMEAGVAVTLVRLLDHRVESSFGALLLAAVRWISGKLSTPRLQAAAKF